MAGASGFVTLTEKDAALAFRALALKRTDRAGWRRVPGVERVESVADHSWGVGFLALLASLRDPTLDRAKLLTLALVHDLAEAVTGDLTPADVAGPEEKHAREREGLAHLLVDLDADVRGALLAAWEDYEARGSREARLVADLDKVEMALQAEAYEDAGADAEALTEFRESARAKIGEPVLRNLVE